ncbi:hypothetical protein [Brucella inopinata]|uniref:hypothetical protein n=1 Tax=Brucella inopinata TaxID=1218315 RepID=UPI000870C8FA|nr:hypothetical protein [Brucella inopinata]SCD22806.1 hypothetical protein BR141012304_10364 [Brucella inopinata]
MAIKIFGHEKLNDVFTPGGQPSVTYVDRNHLGIEQKLKKSIDLPNAIVALTGPTKCGKTVLCRSVLSNYEYVWIDGGQVKKESDLWDKVCSELRLANELTEKTASTDNIGGSSGFEAGVGLPGTASLKFSATANGSRLLTTETGRKFNVDSMQSAIEALISSKICLVVDDFHYIEPDSRASLVRSIKGAVFRGLKVVFLSTPHRAFDTIKAEVEVTGRFKHVTVDPWSEEDLKEIALVGCRALNISISSSSIDRAAKESESSPLLMQRFCWNICYDAGVVETQILNKDLGTVDLIPIFNEVAEDAGLPIYTKLARGPQSRTDRIPRPLVKGGTADIYEAILLAIASTGPLEKLSYDQIRSSLNSILGDKIPQKLEVSNALNHLTKIDAEENNGQRAIEWDQENLTLFLTDPFFRFYLRWKVAHPYTSK